MSSFTSLPSSIGAPSGGMAAAASTGLMLDTSSMFSEGAGGFESMPSNSFASRIGQGMSGGSTGFDNNFGSTFLGGASSTDNFLSSGNGFASQTFAQSTTDSASVTPTTTDAKSSSSSSRINHTGNQKLIVAVGAFMFFSSLAVLV